MTGIHSYDSAQPLAIPTYAPAILPYTPDSAFPWADNATDRFPNARFRWITTYGDYTKASIFDSESGDRLNDTAILRQVVEARIDAFPSDKAIVYCSRNRVAVIQNALAGLDWHLFLATLDGSMPASWNGKPTIAVQYVDVGGRFDQSYWWDENDLHLGPA